MSTPTPLTTTEKALQRVLHSRRAGGIGGRKPYMVAMSPDGLRYRFEAAHRGGPIYSPYGDFDRTMQVEWAIRVLSYLSEQQVEAPAGLGIECDASWDDVRAIVDGVFETKFGADLAEMQTEADDRVVDPWGRGLAAACRWFLANMTQYTVFTVWQVVADAVEDCVAEYLGDWAEGDTEGTPRGDAAAAFETAMQNLDDYIEAAIKAEAG